MIAHRSIVSLGFKLSGLLVGGPAVAAFVVLTVEAASFRQAAAPTGDHLVSLRTYGLVGLLTDAGVGIHRVFSALAGLAAWLFAGLAVVALMLALWAVLLFLVGRGVGRKATWARIVGGVFALLLALTSLIAFTSLPHRLMVAPLPLLALGLYTLWTLIWRYRDAGPPSPAKAGV